MNKDINAYKTIGEVTKLLDLRSNQKKVFGMESICMTYIVQAQLRGNGIR